MNYFFRFVIAAAFFPGISSAETVNPNKKITGWKKHSIQERMQYAKNTTLLCTSSNCTSVDIKACIDEVAQPPIPAAARDVTIGEIAAQCIFLLNK